MAPGLAVVMAPGLAVVMAPGLAGLIRRCEKRIENDIARRSRA